MDKSDHRIDVHIRPGRDVDVRNEDALREIIEQTIVAHIQQTGLSDIGIDVEIQIDKCNCRDGLARVSMLAEGRVGDSLVEKRVSCSRQPMAMHSGTGIAGIAGLIVSAALSAVLNAVAQRAFGADDEARRLEACVAECIADICILVDKTAGRSEDLTSTVWQRVQWLRWAGATCAFLASLVFFFYHRGAKGVPIALLFGFFPAAASFWIVHVLTLACMPSRFFLDEPRGRKAMARSGVQSVVALRILCVILGIVFVAILFCSGALFWGVIQESAK